MIFDKNIIGFPFLVHSRRNSNPKIIKYFFLNLKNLNKFADFLRNLNIQRLKLIRYFLCVLTIL